MKSDSVKMLLKQSGVYLPGYLLSCYKKFNITEKELIFIASITGDNDFVLFDAVALSNKLCWDITEILEIVSSLCDKKIMNLVVKKQNGKMQEYIDIGNLFEKILLGVLGEEEKESSDEVMIYGVIEAELGRTLSPIEYETISGWINANISEELIREALKEAVLNGVNNLKYIDKILYDWTRKGYKKASDVRKKKTSKTKNVDLFEYDWLDENV